MRRIWPPPLDQPSYANKKARTELGNPDAMGILGFMYTEGFGVEKDEAKAQEYFEMERNAPPFTLNDDDQSSNPWMDKTAVEV